MLKWFRKKMCCCFPICKNKGEKNISINKTKAKEEKKEKEKQEKEKEKENKNKKKVSFNTISYLQNITYKETEPFIPDIRFAKVVKVYDGDTITVAAKLPFENSPIYRFSVRLRSIDSPEIKGKSKKECDLAIEARDALHHLIYGKIIELRNNGKEKYGRLLADLYYNDIHINKWMVDNGYAINYDGGKKQLF